MELSEKLKGEFASLRVEILDLNVLTYFFIRKINRTQYIWQKTTRSFCLEELISLRYLENGITIHLVNLDDDCSDFSFRTLKRFFNKENSTNPKIIKEFDNVLKQYRKNLNHLKVDHRNKRIAHLNYTTDLNVDQFLDFEKQLLPLVLEANSIADRLWGEKIEVKFKLGSWEGNLDFRNGTENFKIKLDEVKWFD